MDKQAIIEAVKIFNLMLNPDRRIAGVKFLFDEDELERADAVKISGRMPYCVMVRNATEGKSLKAGIENSGCKGGAKAIGMVELDDITLSGRYYRNLGLYRDLTIAKNVQSSTTFCRHKLCGVMVKPLEDYDVEPDTVLIVTNPYNCMRIVQGYSHIFGFHIAYKMSGHQAICSECTAFPFESNNINVSLLCSGTRYKAKWADNEMAIGFPFNRFIPIVTGIKATLDLVETNEKKADIEERFREADRPAPEIHYNKNYFTGLNPED